MRAHVRTATLCVGLLTLVAPTAHAQVEYLRPGERGLAVMGGYSWGRALAQGAPGLAAGYAFGSTHAAFEVGASFVRFSHPAPDAFEAAPNRTLGFSAGVAVRAGAAPTTLKGAVTYQATRYDEGRYVEDLDGTATALSLTVFHAVDHTGTITFIPQLGAVMVIPNDGGPNSELGFAAALGIRAGTPGRFALLVEPGIVYSDAGLLFSVSVGGLLTGRRP